MLNEPFPENIKKEIDKYEDPEPEKYDHIYWYSLIYPNINLVYLTLPRDVSKELIKTSQYYFSKAFNSNISGIKKFNYDAKIKFSIKNNKKLFDFSNILTKELENNSIFNKGCFAKMHRSPKDSNWDENINDLDYLCCHTGIDILIRFIKSCRIRDDIEDFNERNVQLYIYLFPYSKPNLFNEFRLFIYKSKLVSIKNYPLDYIDDFDIDNDINNNISKKTIYNKDVIEDISNKITNRIKYKYSQCCVDFEIISEDEYRIFEINPLDKTTDLYN